MRRGSIRRPFILAIVLLSSMTGCQNNDTRQTTPVEPKPNPTIASPKTADAPGSDSKPMEAPADRRNEQTHTEVDQMDGEDPTGSSTDYSTAAGNHVMTGMLLHSRSVPFVPHTGTGKYESYLAMNLPFEPVEMLRKKLDADLQLTLNHRGEAHITVVTPPEFERLSGFVSIDDINLIAARRIQQQQFKIICLGESQKLIGDDLARTFYLVVESDDLTELRREIALAYTSSGGPSPAFTSDYHPHITIGFTHRDLHRSDGAIKNAQSCIEPD